LVLDLTTGGIQELSADFPMIYKIPPLPDFGRYTFSGTAYDPTLTRVVYASAWADYSGIILWDLVKHQEITRLPAEWPWDTPLWNTDGSAFIISLPPQVLSQDGVRKIIDDHFEYLSGSEFFIVSREGEIRRLTYLTVINNIEEGAYSWSPDGKQVAFWMKTDKDPQWQLAIINIESGQIINYCVGGGDGGYPLIWAPDGQYLAGTYGMPDWYITNATRIVLLDIKGNTATLVPGKDIVIGWMDSDK
jgi:hypothetical protein